MKGDILLLDFDSIYDNQSFYEDCDYKVISVKGISGTNSYCDKYGQEQIKEKLRDVSEGSLSFIGSGNYHYVSLFLTEKINEDFTLILFDNHSDIQKPLFEELLSCGGWVREALLKEEHLKQVILIGINDYSKNLIEEKLRDRVIVMAYSYISKNPNWYEDLKNFIKYPVYISVDKDVFNEEEVVTNWDQGEMTMEDFKHAFSVIRNNFEILGMDVCGECSIDYKDIEEFERANRKNNSANGKLLEKFKESQGKN